MRVSDVMMQSSYMANINKTKQRLQELQEQSITGQKISRPSDSPSGVVSVMALNKKIQSAESYLSNIDKSLGFLNETENNLNVIESEITKIMSNLTLVKDATNADNLDTFAEQIDLSLQTILSAANSDFDGKYLFSGTDYSTKPYDFTNDTTSIEVKSNSVSGEQNVNLSTNVQQKINITGTELFGTIIKQGGTLDGSAANGTVVTGSTSIYNAEGIEYTLNVSYEKTAANTYEMTYDIVDGGSVSIYGTPPAAQTMVFDSATGMLKTVDGNDPSLFNIKDSTNKIDININFKNIKETSASALTFSANQNVDIFNTLLNIKEQLLGGIVPTDEEIDAVKSFHTKVLDNLTRNGNVMNQLENTQSLLNNKILNLEELLANEQSVDQAEIIMEMQNQDYQLQMAYKISSMILPKSLLDYL